MWRTRTCMQTVSRLHQVSARNGHTHTHNGAHHPHTSKVQSYTHMHMSDSGGRTGHGRAGKGGAGMDSAVSTTGNKKARAMTKSPSAGRGTHPPPPTNRSAAHTGSRVALWLQTSCPWSTHTWGPRGRSTPPGRGGTRVHRHTCHRARCMISQQYGRQMAHVHTQAYHTHAHTHMHTLTQTHERAHTYT